MGQGVDKLVTLPQNFFARGLIGALIESIGVEKWLEANLEKSLKQVRTLIEEEVLRKEDK